LQPSFRSIANTITKAEARKNHPRRGWKNQKAVALNAIHSTIPKLPRISKDVEYAFASLLIGTSSPLAVVLKVTLIFNPQHVNAIKMLRAEKGVNCEFFSYTHKLFKTPKKQTTKKQRILHIEVAKLQRG
jgi:hypothetical protein